MTPEPSLQISPQLATYKAPRPRDLLPKRQRVAAALGERGRSWIEWSSYAVHHPYISLNDPTVEKVGWLAIDCDHGDYDGFPGSLPKPKWTAITRDTGRHHHVWRLKTPVLMGEQARRKPMALLAAVQTGLTHHLDGDPCFNNVLTKNPWSENWSTIWWNGADVDLMDFSDWLLPKGVKLIAANGNAKPKASEARGYGRNVDLFDHVRHWAYKRWDGDREQVYAVAHAFNEMFADPLKTPEVNGVAKSVCRFMETEYTGTPKPAVKREQTRQAKSAAILAAEASIRASGQRPTIDMIVAITGIPRNTVSRIQQTL